MGENYTMGKENFVRAQLNPFNTTCTGEEEGPVFGNADTSTISNQKAVKWHVVPGGLSPLQPVCLHLFQQDGVKMCTEASKSVVCRADTSAPLLPQSTEISFYGRAKVGENNTHSEPETSATDCKLLRDAGRLFRNSETAEGNRRGGSRYKDALKIFKIQPTLRGSQDRGAEPSYKQQLPKEWVDVGEGKTKEEWRAKHCH